MSHVIEFEQLSRHFGRTEAVRDLTFGVPQGSIYAFLGPNGAGKTTTIKVLMNLLDPSGGRAAVFGRDSIQLQPADLARIGYVSENQVLPEWMTPEQLLAFCKPLYPTWDDGLCGRLLRMFDLPPHRKIRTFSRGMKMKVAMVAALTYRPRLLVLDEPFSGLDPLVRDEIIEGMLELSGEEEWTIFVSSHDLSEIENLADHVGFIREGRLVLSEALGSLQERFREIEVTLPRPWQMPAAWPRDWLSPKTADGVVRFVDTQYEPQRTEQTSRASFPPEAGYSASPMTLREIFVALARAANDKGARS